MADKFIRDIAAYEAAGEQARKKAAEMEGIQAEAVVSLRATTHRTALSSVASTARPATARSGGFNLQADPVGSLMHQVPFAGLNLKALDERAQLAQPLGDRGRSGGFTWRSHQLAAL